MNKKKISNEQSNFTPKGTRKRRRKKYKVIIISETKNWFFEKINTIDKTLNKTYQEKNRTHILKTQICKRSSYNQPRRKAEACKRVLQLHANNKKNNLKKGISS